MTINIDIKQFEALLQYIEDQKVIHDNKHIKFRIHGTDFYNDLGIDPNKSEDNKKYFADGLHPNDLGHEVIADKIISFISKL